MRGAELFATAAGLGVLGALPGFLVEAYPFPATALPGMLVGYLFFVVPFFTVWLFPTALAGLWLVAMAGVRGAGSQQWAIVACCAAAALPWSLLYGLTRPACVSSAFWCAVLLALREQMFSAPRSRAT